MKADDVLKLYVAGRRDFSGENLIGQSFKGKDLSGANFSDADIRGVDFSNAVLRGANFRHARAGIQKRWVIIWLIVSLLVSALSGYFSAFAGASLEIFFRFPITKEFTTVPGMTVLVALGIFFIVTLRQGLEAGLGTLAIAGAVPLAIALSADVVNAVAKALISTLGGTQKVGAAGAEQLVGASVLIVGSGASAGVIAGVASVAGVAAGTAAGGVAGFMYVAGVVVVAGVVAVSRVQHTGAISQAVTGALILLSTYVALRALAEDKKYTLVRKFGIAFAAVSGTSFRNADLTDADFTSATLKSTDFRRANLARTRWHQARKLDRIRPGTTYLQFPQIQQLLITGQGQAQNFDRQILRGVNLQGANLADASFIGADLNEANLQEADLSRAKLVQTQLDEADLTGATLTGAYIEDWGITSHTKLHGVRCEYVFMREPTKEDPNPRRKPDNWKETFEDGDFADFIKPIVDTLDLYHSQDVDPRAIAITFKQLAENYPDAELEIVAMEKRGQDKFLLRAATAPDADRSALSAEYFATYNQIKALAEQQKILLAEKDTRIRSLENMVETALQRPSFYAQTYQNYGDTMSDRKINIDQSGASIGVGYSEKVEAEQVGGTIHNYAPEQKQTLAEAAAEIQQLLKQLEETYPTATVAEKQSALAVTLQQEIKQNPTFKARLRNALKAGGIEALKVLFAPIGIPIEMVRGWIEPEAE